MERSKWYIIAICIVEMISWIIVCGSSQENISSIQWIEQNEGILKLLLIMLNGISVIFLRKSYITKQKKIAEEWEELAVVSIIIALLLETFIACEYNIPNENLALIIKISVFGTSIVVAKACATELLQPNRKRRKSGKNISYIVLFIIFIKNFLWKKNYYTLHIIGSIILLISWHKVCYQNKKKEEFYQ